MPLFFSCIDNTSIITQHPIKFKNFFSGINNNMLGKLMPEFQFEKGKGRCVVVSLCYLSWTRVFCCSLTYDLFLWTAHVRCRLINQRPTISCIPVCTVVVYRHILYKCKIMFQPFYNSHVFLKNMGMSRSLSKRAEFI